LAEVFPDEFWEEVGGKDAFHPVAVQECAAGAIFWSTVFAYDANRIPPEQAAKTWADFWNVDKFPGARSLRRSPRSNLEFARLADGAPLDRIYDLLRTPEGVDRAFRKLDEIKPYVKKWWEAGAQPPQLLADGEVAYATAYNGRIYDANVKEGQNFKVVWTGHNYTLDLYVIPKGSPNKELALKFIAFSLRPDRQAAMTDHISYGPVATAAIPLINPKVLPHLPNAPENFEQALLVDEEFWTENLEPLTERFEAWLAQ
ncbi:MAG: extracellular solute-binding protein, partial [Alphaproteobacteria bacterium]